MPARSSLIETSRVPGGFSCTVFLAVLVFAATVSAQPPAATPGVEERLARAVADERWDDALAHADTLAFERHLDYLASLQRIVGLHCLDGDTEAAYTALDDLLEAGFWNFRSLRQDDDLAAINDQDRFRQTLRAAWARQYIKMLERDSRAEMQLPDRIMAALDLQAGESVADIGAGSGYFTLPMAAAVGPNGLVRALDIRKEMLDHIADRVEEAGLTNVELGLVASEDPLLDPASVDTIIMVDVFHYIQERTAYARKLRDGLAPGGRLVVIDFRYEPEADREFAPPPEQQVARADLDADLARAGFRVRESFDFLPEQYFVVYEVE